MSGLLIRTGEWVVVCDGAKALVLVNEGDTRVPRLKTVRTLAQDDLPTHEQGTDAPGRTINSIGSARSAVEQTDWHDQAERAFLIGLARYLDAAVAGGKAKSVIMVAPPRALGMIRPAYGQALKAALRTEIDKDFVKLPVDVIEKRLAGA
jgi:protein required for attachment to host cells